MAAKLATFATVGIGAVGCVAGGLFVVSVVITLVVLVSGLFFFRATERTFADVI